MAPNGTENLCLRRGKQWAGPGRLGASQERQTIVGQAEGWAQLEPPLGAVERVLLEKGRSILGWGAQAIKPKWVGGALESERQDKTPTGGGLPVALVDCLAWGRFATLTLRVDSSWPALARQNSEKKS